MFIITIPPSALPGKIERILDNLPIDGVEHIAERLADEIGRDESQALSGGRRKQMCTLVTGWIHRLVIGLPYS